MHYNDTIMRAMAPQIASLMIVYSTVYSRRRSKKLSKLRVTGGEFTGDRLILRKKRAVTRKMFPFDDVIMQATLLFLYTVNSHGLQIIIPNSRAMENGSQQPLFPLALHVYLNSSLPPPPPPPLSPRTRWPPFP